jgi:hypothetical protein
MRKRRFSRVLLLGFAILFAVEAESSAMVRRLFRRPACGDRCDAGKTKETGEAAKAPSPPAFKGPRPSGPATPPEVPLPPIEDRGPPADAKDLRPLTTP